MLTQGHYVIMLILYFLHIVNASTFKMTNPRMTVTLCQLIVVFQVLSSDSLLTPVFNISWILLKFKSTESRMLSNSLILCHPNLSQSGSFPVSPALHIGAKVLGFTCWSSIQWIFIVSSSVQFKMWSLRFAASALSEILEDGSIPNLQRGAPRSLCPFRQLLCIYENSERCC